ncbi:MAG TPA: bifunctional proline dehydrogenase/L-glutamate gamma-semialdehyde dehydrogenase PutA [Steroidobacter sp.]|uniref:bifunctional proline dehydrogenase/L-glutamate gamma-semialdehyde dehydrogenase PutA n=1 Tax=Steroidobacter sp. TaxID=1978227 RepID=UPI002ED8B0E5
MVAQSSAIPAVPSLEELREQIRSATLQDETRCVQALLESSSFSIDARARARARAAALVTGARARARERPLLDSFLQQFALSNEEGVALMCLAEGLLRIPDDDTADRLIADKIASGNWSAHAGQSHSTWVNASTWGLMLTGKLVELPKQAREETTSWVQSLSRRLSAPVLRTAFRQAMRIIGGEFVVGRTIEEALARSAKTPELALCSFDMLGEGARTWADAERYRKSYEQALDAIGAQRKGTPIDERSNLSVKLSALEPKYDQMHEGLVAQRLTPIVMDLARRAAAADVGFTIDAEEADRLDVSLNVFEALARDRTTQSWQGLGIVIQAYGKRAPLVIEWVATLARITGRRICIRLVKGAYWDAEIKRAQERGLASYPVFTRKVSTDVSYLACAERLFRHRDVIYPMFATHNAHTLAAVLELRPPGAKFEFQRLHGMGALLHDEAKRQIEDFPRVRAYAPVGHHEELLSYLVRRLLENGANSSFVNRFMNESVPVDTVVEDPIAALQSADSMTNPNIPLPKDLYGDSRENSAGVDWGNPQELAKQIAALQKQDSELPLAAPSTLAGPIQSPPQEVRNPADRAELVGRVSAATREDIALAFDKAAQARKAWDGAGATHRAVCLVAAADGLRLHRAQLVRLLVKEAGKTLPDAIAEVREAEDFCRYYAAQAREHFAEPLALPGPTGEDNKLSLRGRGVFACISPWNFPLAIFLGQVTAALVAGNSVVAKPAETTPLVAALAVRILHEAGVPHDVLHFVPAPGKLFGEVAFKHPALGGVCFTGSTSTAQFINRALAARDGAIVPLIAETGGINAMIVDSSALLEQVADDVLTSAFTSAGQRCSALRLLFVQDDVADRLIELIAGGMDQLQIGDPAAPSTDVGPVIDTKSASKLEDYSKKALQRGIKLLKQCSLDKVQSEGSYFAPRMFELNDARELTSEEFGPILHVVRYKRDKLRDVLAAIRDAGYGLTLGVHTRIESVWQEIVAEAAVGNIYINRNMIGAVVGVQPFGGEGLSGTGPKAGGPHYLFRFATERTLTVNTVATGGNAKLLSLGS